jgi:metal-dependent amidase/aminoacylase/carboxypeptidase family protein
VRRCFEAGALATGCELEIEAEAPPYAEFRNDPDLLRLYRANAERLGRQFAPAEGAEGTAPGGAGAGTAGGAGNAGNAGAGRMNRASTDMGNVSLVVPSIHPYIGIGSLPAVNHQKEFAAHCVTRAADRALIDGAIGLAWTAADAALDEAIRGRLLAGGH